MKNFAEIMDALKAAGTEQTRKIYRNHGAGENLFGVKFGDLRKIAKKIKADFTVSEELWFSGNADAMSLAIMISDPHTFDTDTLNKWVEKIDFSAVADVFVKEIVMPSGAAYNIAEKWYSDKREFVSRCGFFTISWMAFKSSEIDDFCYFKYLEFIKSNIRKAPDKAKEAMNSALINIGKKGPELKNIALSIADYIGPLEIDHGKTSCYTSDAYKVISNPNLKDKFVK